jgi:hypothetical protein
MFAGLMMLVLANMIIMFDTSAKGCNHPGAAVAYRPIIARDGTGIGNFVFVDSVEGNPDQHPDEVRVPS